MSTKPLGRYRGEVPAEPARRGARVTDAQGDTWQRGTKWWRCQAADMKLSWPYLVRWYGPIREAS